jgi:hypothetical protein
MHTNHLPSSPDWIHEIKLDGFRMMVRRDPAGVRLISPDQSCPLRGCFCSFGTSVTGRAS